MDFSLHNLNCDYQAPNQLKNIFSHYTMTACIKSFVTLPILSKQSSLNITVDKGKTTDSYILTPENATPNVYKLVSICW